MGLKPCYNAYEVLNSRWCPVLTLCGRQKGVRGTGSWSAHFITWFRNENPAPDGKNGSSDTKASMNSLKAPDGPSNGAYCCEPPEESAVPVLPSVPASFGPLCHLLAQNSPWCCLSAAQRLR